MLRYQTEIEIAADRYVCLQLPLGLHAGRATVTVVSLAREEAVSAPSMDEAELDRDDVEWWEEFDDETGPAGPV